MTGKITVTTDPEPEYLILTLWDDGSSRSTDYSVTANEFTATGGFGGISYSSVNMLEIHGASTAAGGTTTLDVAGAPDHALTYFRSHAKEGASTHLHVDAEADADAAYLEFDGGDGSDSIDVERTPGALAITAGREGGDLLLSSGGSTSGIRHDVTIRGGGPLDAVIDDSAGLVAHDATLTTTDDVAKFTGFWGTGSPIFSGGVRRLVYKAPKGLDNVLRLDLGPRGLLAMTDLEYDGGGDLSSGTGGRLILEGPEQTQAFGTEVHTATGPDSGSMVIWQWFQGEQRIGYSGLAAGGLVDLMAATDYQFIYQGADDPGVAVTDGEVSDATAGAQTLRIASQATSPAFIATTIANKVNVAIHTNGTTNLATLVDYASDEPVAGLASLTIVTSPNDAVDAVATPPGVDFAVQTTASPRPEPVAPRAEQTTAEPTTEQPTTVAQTVQPTIALPAAGPTASVPIEDASPAWDAPTPQVVGAGFAARFGAVMRTGPPLRGSAEAASPFRSLRTARKEQFQALRARRAERSHAVVLRPRNARMRAMNTFDGTHVDVRTMRHGA